MKKLAFFVVIFVLLIGLCSCLRRGPYEAPVSQLLEEITKVELIDGTEDTAVLQYENYEDFVICTLEGEQVIVFMEELSAIDFFKPALEPARHLGAIAARIYYKDGSCDLIGSNCHYTYDSELNILTRGVRYPDMEHFYALFGQFVDVELLPR